LFARVARLDDGMQGDGGGDGAAGAAQQLALLRAAFGQG
jgi:hypothetical protein